MGSSSCCNMNWGMNNFSSAIFRYTFGTDWYSSLPFHAFFVCCRVECFSSIKSARYVPCGVLPLTKSSISNEEIGFSACIECTPNRCHPLYGFSGFVFFSPAYCRTKWCRSHTTNALFSLSIASDIVVHESFFEFIISVISSTKLFDTYGHDKLCAPRALATFFISNDSS